MSTSLTITVKSGRSVADLARFIKDTSDPRGEARALAHLFQRLASGTEPGSSFEVQTSATAPGHASNFLTLTYASITTNDTVVIAGHTLTCVTGTPSGEDQFKKVTDLATTVANLVACINANSVLSLLMKAVNTSTGVVTMTLHAPGAIGNQAPLVGSTGMVAHAALFAGGTGGHETAAVSYSRGL